MLTTAARFAARRSTLALTITALAAPTALAAHRPAADTSRLGVLQGLQAALQHACQDPRSPGYLTDSKSTVTLPWHHQGISRSLPTASTDATISSCWPRTAEMANYVLPILVLCCLRLSFLQTTMWTLLAFHDQRHVGRCTATTRCIASEAL